MNKSYYMTYDKTDKTVVWGDGKTPETSYRNAIRNVNNWKRGGNYADSVIADDTIKNLKTVPCDYSMIVFMEYYSGEYVQWGIKNGVAHLTGFTKK